MPATPADDLRGVNLLRTVVVSLGDRAETAAGDHRRLAALVARLTGVDPASVTLHQVCPHCGEAGHGPLEVVFSGAAVPALAVHVSLARAAGKLALAVTAAGPVGIDIESIAELTRAPVADVLLSPAETDAFSALDPGRAPAALAALWTAKEAVLKAAGVGLRVDPRDLTVVLDGAGAPVRLAGWPSAPFPVTALHLLPAPAPVGAVATVAVLCADRPRVHRIAAPPR
ncbi:4'-phosphopantetheinyl transferase superfamily protein [Cryobacterium sp. 1639]|uniref:4'-phosphopantetheinyl transferase family protein n=1 Tax=Cryobacterium inferilacus TaxID=2866629 RepID=UPI001C734E37|nr:4'-phosphopantetheinyl transferase superfamily protein [Cryobacterium sp. 1639]MBX0300322.1 4'-phosphopantetheinyl transferase superfamily protein [Cryobacterium sp. 1639]